MSNIRYNVFLPPFMLLLLSCLISLIYPESFLSVVKTINQWILQTFEPVFSWTSFIGVLFLGYLYFSPISKTIIGGPSAQPILSRWKWFSITLCTTLATGILFWGTAEPLYHLHQPPEGINALAGSEAARDFAMSTMFMHWTLTPYAIYTIMGLFFALCYYNLKQPFSLGSLLFPVFGQRAHGVMGKLTDIICLFALVAGMAASLGSGIMTISGGLQKLFEIPNNALTYGIVGLFIVLSFCLSAASGLMKGIRLLSDYNIRMFIVMSLFILICGPTWEILQIGGAGVIDYVQHFFYRSVNIVEPIDSSWRQNWSVFYWANWLAWAPIAALFLGRIAYGYSVRAFITVNLLLTSLFSGLWMIIFSGASLHIDMEVTNHFLYEQLNQLGPESVMYEILTHFPFPYIISIIFLAVTFLSFVTAADSNTSAMSNISSQNNGTAEQIEGPLLLKLLWGSIIGLMAWVMISYAGIDGLKILSTLGGFPALFLMIVVLIGWVRLVVNRKKWMS